MRIRVSCAINSWPGCDFLSGSRSVGLSLFMLGISIGLLWPCWTLAQNLSTPVRTQPFVGSVVSEIFVLKDVTKPISEKSIVVTPAGAALVHVSQPRLPEGQITISTLFRRTGQVSIRFPAGMIRDNHDGTQNRVKAYEVRPWPRAMVAESDGGLIRAGVGGLSATLSASEESTEAGASVRIDFTLVGPAAMAVENVPELRIRAEENSTEDDSRFRPMLVDEKVEWADGAGTSSQRTWSFEWRAEAPGAFRVEPVRIVHLDDAGTIQTRLVSGPGIRIRPRALFRVAKTGAEQQAEKFDRNAIFRRNKFAIVGMIASVMFSFVLAVGIRGLLRSRWLLKRRLERALRQAMTQRQAQAIWRAFEPERRRIRNGGDPCLDLAHEELTRRAFGRQREVPSSVAVVAAEEGG
ncbi:hypothetical protein GC170_15375 [bacterium]|nr:hypothetical protein [bacterium]